MYKVSTIIKKRYNFTLDEDVMEWLKYYCKENRTTCSAFINQMLASLMNREIKPAKTMRSVPTKSY